MYNKRYYLSYFILVLLLIFSCNLFNEDIEEPDQEVNNIEIKSIIAEVIGDHQVKLTWDYEGEIDSNQIGFAIKRENLSLGYFYETVQFYEKNPRALTSIGDTNILIDKYGLFNGCNYRYSICVLTPRIMDMLRGSNYYPFYSSNIRSTVKLTGYPKPYNVNIEFENNEIAKITWEDNSEQEEYYFIEKLNSNVSREKICFLPPGSKEFLYWDNFDGKENLKICIGAIKDDKYEFATEFLSTEDFSSFDIPINLESKDDILFKRNEDDILDFIATDNNIFLLCSNSIIKLDYNFNILTELEHNGVGTHEIISWFADDNLIILSYKDGTNIYDYRGKLKIYSTEGELIRILDNLGETYSIKKVDTDLYILAGRKYRYSWYAKIDCFGNAVVDTCYYQEYDSQKLTIKYASNRYTYINNYSKLWIVDQRGKIQKKLPFLGNISPLDNDRLYISGDIHRVIDVEGNYLEEKPYNVNGFKINNIIETNSGYMASVHYTQRYTWPYESSYIEMNNNGISAFDKNFKMLYYKFHDKCDVGIFYNKHTNKYLAVDDNCIYEL
ncbi:MAG: hypothetical protein K9N05_05310 [Candidatus Marinimicrobia bacterium]|nr:hypothetical protein [Candidatus Neomarinimicrobiota bacterium]